MSKKTTKIFIGFFLSKEWQQKVEKLKQAFATQRGLRWTLPQNLHITQFFIGPVSTAKVDQILAAMKTIAIKNRPFTLVFDRFFVAPPDNPGTMLWMQFKDSPEFIMLAREIMRAVDSITVMEEDPKKPNPHVTIARGKNIPNSTFNVTMKDPVMTIDHIAVVEANTRRDEIEYTIVQKFPFKSYQPERPDDFVTP